MNNLQHAGSVANLDTPCLSDVFEVLSEVQKGLDEVSGIAGAVDERMSGSRPVAACLSAPVAVPSGKVAHLLEMARAILGDVSRLHRTVSDINSATS